jgi:hypothetical protein
MVISLNGDKFVLLVVSGQLFYPILRNMPDLLPGDLINGSSPVRAVEERMIRKFLSALTNR